MASGIDPKFLNVDFNQNIEKTGLYKFTKKKNYFVLDLKTFPETIILS